MGAGTQASPEPNPTFPWEQQGMYKPRGRRIYYYPDYPELPGASCTRRS